MRQRKAAEAPPPVKEKKSPRTVAVVSGSTPGSSADNPVDPYHVGARNPQLERVGFAVVLPFDRGEQQRFQESVDTQGSGTILQSFFIVQAQGLASESRYFRFRARALDVEFGEAGTGTGRAVLFVEKLGWSISVPFEALSAPMGCIWDVVAKAPGKIKCVRVSEQAWNNTVEGTDAGGACASSQALQRLTQLPDWVPDNFYSRWRWRTPTTSRETSP